MKKILLSILAILCLLCATAQKTGKQPLLKTSGDSLCYALGEFFYQYALNSFTEQSEATAITGDETSEVPQTITVVEKSPEYREAFHRGVLFALKNLATTPTDPYFEGLVHAYSTFTTLASNLEDEELGVEFDYSTILAAYSKATESGNLLFEEPVTVVQEIIAGLAAEKEKRIEAEMRIEYAEKIKKEEKFLAENKKLPGVVTLPSGIQYKVILKGPDPKAKPDSTDWVAVSYTATTSDNDVVDSNIDEEDQAYDYEAIDQIGIKGWKYVIPLMAKGDKWLVFFPAEYALGHREYEDIAPFSTLIYEVTLLDFTPAPAIDEDDEVIEEEW